MVADLILAKVLKAEESEYLIHLTIVTVYSLIPFILMACGVIQARIPGVYLYGDGIPRDCGSDCLPDPGFFRGAFETDAHLRTRTETFRASSPPPEDRPSMAGLTREGRASHACVKLSQAIARKTFAGRTALAGISRKLETTFF